MIQLSQVGTVAAKEFRDRLRNRWVLAVALVFAVFSLVIAYAGGAQQGAVGLRSLEFTVTSLVSLVIYLVPLIALLLGFDAIVGERERGSLDLLLAYPITRGELLLGKYLGLSLALALAMLAGLAAVGVMLVYQFGSKALFHYAGFVLSALVPRAPPSCYGSCSCWCSTWCCWACWWPPPATTAATSSRTCCS